jgi:hypothetical protein
VAKASRALQLSCWLSRRGALCALSDGCVGLLVALSSGKVPASGLGALKALTARQALLALAGAGVAVLHDAAVRPGSEGEGRRA